MLLCLVACKKLQEENNLNNIKLKNKFILVFLIGVIIPLICTNGFLFYMIT